MSVKRMLESLEYVVQHGRFVVPSDLGNGIFEVGELPPSTPRGSEASRHLDISPIFLSEL
jgi:hypothetical protein